MSEYIDIPVQLDEKTAKALNKMTKPDLIDRVCSLAVESKTYELRCQTAIEEADELQRKVASLQTRLDKAETYIEQARAMIDGVMERWYHYDN